MYDFSNHFGKKIIKFRAIMQHLIDNLAVYFLKHLGDAF